MKKHVILGVHITGRVDQAVNIQKIFTEYGCNIKTRLGLHETGPEYCAPSGVVLLEMTGEETETDVMMDKLNAMHGVEAKKMVFID
ncbi:MAG TPA: hypothetical protein PKW95_17915 [bacterium]|nr:hypothetical protein [bacterium]